MKRRRRGACGHCSTGAADRVRSGLGRRRRPRRTVAERSLWTEEKHQQFEAVKRWFYQDWLRIDARLRTSIVEGISVFLSLFDDNPAVKRVFCPPKETYDPERNRDGRYGRPLPPFARADRAGQGVRAELPGSANPGLARTIGTLMKQDFQRAVLNRIPKMERERQARALAAGAVSLRRIPVLCHRRRERSVAATRSSSRSPGRRSASRSSPPRASARCARRLPGESWRTLLQTFRTKIFLALSDDFSARTACDLAARKSSSKPTTPSPSRGRTRDQRVHRPRRSRTRSVDRTEELQRAARLCLRAEGLRGTKNAQSDRAGLRRR